MRPRLQSITLDVDGQTIAGIRQCDPALPDPPRMLCLHGWLDNANSFMPMMPWLPSFDLVAIDLPGHGYSSALPQGYSLHEVSFCITRILEALGWQDCHLVGHSLGGNLAPLVAVSLPEAILSLTLIEAAGPLSEQAEKLPARMVRALRDRQRAARFESRLFPDKQSAVDSRLRAAKMADASARLIIERQLAESDGGYRWRFDPRWRLTSAQYMTEAQVQAILAAISCRSLCVLARDGYLSTRETTEQRLQCLPDNQLVTLTGHHHLHMDSPEPVAAAINRFLEAMPDLGS